MSVKMLPMLAMTACPDYANDFVDYADSLPGVDVDRRIKTIYSRDNLCGDSVEVGVVLRNVNEQTRQSLDGFKRETESRLVGGCIYCNVLIELEGHKIGGTVHPEWPGFTVTCR